MKPVRMLARLSLFGLLAFFLFGFSQAAFAFPADETAISDADDRPMKVAETEKKKSSKAKKSKKSGSPASGAMAARAKKNAKKKKDDTGKTVDESKYPEPFNGQRIVPKWRFSLGVDMAFYDDGTDAIQAYTFRPGGQFVILKKKLSLNFDMGLGILSGDAKTSFIIPDFNIGFLYALYNKKPIIIAAGLDLRFISQSLQDVFSMDVFHPRPFVTVGMAFIDRVFITPFFGIPIFIDTNSGNNSSATKCANGTSNAASQKCYPQRIPDYSLDKNPFGIDYGIPVAFRVFGGVHLVAEPTGITLIYPEHQTAIFVTPGINYKTKRFQAGAGVQLRVWESYPTDERMWQVVVKAGVTF